MKSLGKNFNEFIIWANSLLVIVLEGTLPTNNSLAPLASLIKGKPSTSSVALPRRVILDADAQIAFSERDLQSLSVFCLGFWLVRIFPNDNFIEIFAQRFHYFKDPFYKFFALNLLFQDTSCSLALKYWSFLFKFSVLHFIILISSLKSVKFAPKFCLFLKILHSRGITGPCACDIFACDEMQPNSNKLQILHLRRNCWWCFTVVKVYLEETIGVLAEPFLLCTCRVSSFIP